MNDAHNARDGHHGVVTTRRFDPKPESNCTHERAAALTWMRGCEEWNDCWRDCYQNALESVVEDRLDDAEREWATTSTYWKLTHGEPVNDV